MTTDSELWKMVVSHEREFGGVLARQNATDQNVARIADAVTAGFAEHKAMIIESMRSATESNARESAHVRGEIARLDDQWRQNREADEQDRKRHREEEDRRTAELIRNLRETAERSEAAAAKVKQLNRQIIFVVVFVGACASAFIENAPALFNIIGHLFDASLGN